MYTSLKNNKWNNVRLSRYKKEVKKTVVALVYDECTLRFEGRGKMNLLLRWIDPVICLCGTSQEWINWCKSYTD